MRKYLQIAASMDWERIFLTLLNEKNYSQSIDADIRDYLLIKISFAELVEYSKSSLVTVLW